MAQRIERSIDACASAWVAGQAVQSSKAMAMSERSASCTAIESSGVSRTSLPSTGERNRTPSSVILRILARLKTWNPPESVRIGRDQCMKRCRPPSSSMSSAPGRSMRWKVLPRTISAPRPSSSSGVIALTVP